MSRRTVTRKMKIKHTQNIKLVNVAKKVGLIKLQSSQKVDLQVNVRLCERDIRLYGTVLISGNKRCKTW